MVVVLLLLWLSDPTALQAFKKQQATKNKQTEV